MDEKVNESSGSLGMDKNYAEERERAITRKRKRKGTLRRLNNPMPFDFSLNQGNLDLITNGRNFVPHLFIVNEGEDMIAEIISFSQRCARDIYISSGNGTVSHVGISSFGRTSIYEGSYEIVSFKGYLSPTILHSGNIADNLLISVAGPDNSLYGGNVSDSVIAASQILIVIYSFTTPSVPGSSDLGASSTECSSKKK